MEAKWNGLVGLHIFISQECKTMTAPCCYSDVNGTSCKCRMRKAAEDKEERNAALAIAAMTRLSEAREAWLAFKDANTIAGHWRAVELMNAALSTPYACVSEQNHSPDAGNMVDASALRGIAERDANG